MRYELSGYEWAAIKPILSNKPRGLPRVNDRCILNGISNEPGRFEGPEKKSWDSLTCNYTSRFASSTRRIDGRYRSTTT